MQQAGAADPEPGRLRWRCGRGVKELDLLLTGYLTEHWQLSGTAQKAAFERILELPDPLLAAYLLQREIQSDPDMEQVLAILRQQARSGMAPAAGHTRPSRPAGS